MPSLLGSAQNDPDNPITSLLGSIGSALSGGVAQPTDTGSSMAALLAAAGSMANAGAPTLGPPPTTAQAILGSLGAGRSAAISNEILPYVQNQAMLAQQEQQLEYETKLFNYNRQRAYYDLIKGGAGLGDTSAAAPAAAPANVAAPSKPGETPNYAALPDVQSLPDATRVPTIAMMTQVGMTPDEASQYARMLKAESAGLHIDPKTGEVIKNAQSGATGVAQVMPDTFTDMAKKYAIPGANTDLVSNLLAGGHYFHDQVVANNGDIRNATMAYDMGPTGLSLYQQGKMPLPDETADYLIKTGAPPPAGSYQVASSGSNVPGPPGAPVAALGAADPMVPDAIVHSLMVPRSIEQAAMTAGLAGGPLEHSKVIQDYVEKKALMPSFVPGPAPGTQINTQTGERSAAPPGTASLSPLTPEERTRLFPNGMDRPVLGVRDPNGTLTDLKYPEVPEPQITLTDAQAQAPVDQGGVGAAYRTGASYQRGAWSGKIAEVPVSRATGPPLPTAPGAPTVMTPQQQQAVDFLNGKAQGDPRIQNFQLQLGYLGRMANLAADPSRSATDDMAALAAFEKFNNPTAVVSREGEDLVLTTGGPEQRVQTVLAHLTGGRFLTPDVMQNIINTASTESEGARAGFTVASNAYRLQAKARGVDPDLVTPDPDQTIQQYEQQWTKSQERLRSGQGVGGQTPVPGAAPTTRAGTAPAAPTTAPAATTAPNTGTPAATDRLTDAGLGLMTPQGLTALGQDMQRNPGNYSAHDRQLYIDHLAKR